jgi:nitroimidazol reductase NimA-like FMN-containing flavoprotein (pyridoxamine 5'-phosphate oxidase superfamily)
MLVGEGEDMDGGRLNTGFEELDADECFELLGQSGIGRLVVAGERGRPEIFPVYYYMAERRVLFWTDTGTKLTASTGHEVAFEVDCADPAAKTGWSVIVRGIARQWDPRQFRLHSTPWVNTVRPFLIAIDPTEITGRRLQESGGSHP